VYEDTCPECGADDLEVTGGSFTATGMKLSNDGFSTCDAKQLDTADETVTCRTCGAGFALSELTKD